MRDIVAVELILSVDAYCQTKDEIHRDGMIWRKSECSRHDMDGGWMLTIGLDYVMNLHPAVYEQHSA